MPAEPQDARVRAAINTAFLASGGRVPGIDELAARTELSRDAAFESLHRLDARGYLALRPGTLDLWTAPPFSATPTPHRVAVGESHSWASSAWCALGILAMAKSGGVIHTTIGGESENVAITVGETGPTTHLAHVVHFAVPAHRWRESITYACSETLLFASDYDIDQWSERHNLPRGASISLPKAWALAKAWYGDGQRAECFLRHRSDEEAVFRSVGLEGPFFSMHPERI